MVKYLENVLKRLKDARNGMSNNLSAWEGQPETTESVQEKIDMIEATGRDVSKAEDALKESRAKARKMREMGTILADKIESLATGIHIETPVKLNEYSITTRKYGTSVPRPTGILIPVIEDDTSGSGFIVSTQFDPDATYYEWLKGKAADVKDLNTTPEMILFRTTTKTSFTDFDIEKGVRYFYRVQAVNAKGPGPVSEAVCRVQ